MSESAIDRSLARVKLLSKEEVAELLGKRPRTIMAWAHARRSGFPAPVRLSIDSEFRWRLVDVEAFVERSLRHPPPPRPRRGGHLLQGPKPKVRVRLKRKPVTEQRSQDESQEVQS